MLPPWVSASCLPWELGDGSGERPGPGPQASAMWPHDFQMAIPGLELTLPQHPSAQNRCRPHLASGECQLACGCVYGAASDTLVDMLRPGGSETTYSYVDWPWVWGTPELAPHVQCGHRLAPGGGGPCPQCPCAEFGHRHPQCLLEDWKAASPAICLPLLVCFQPGPRSPQDGLTVGVFLDAGMFWQRWELG